MRIVFILLFLGLVTSCGSKGGGSIADAVKTVAPTIPSTGNSTDYFPKCSDPKDTTIPFHAKGILNSGNYYLICTAAELAAINTSADTLGYSYSLGQDIDLVNYYTGDYLQNPGNTFIIGSYPNSPFIGTFTGNGYSILNYRYVNTTEQYCGLFGYVKNSNIQQVELGDPRIDSSFGFCGTIVGYAESSTINEVYTYTYQTSLLPSDKWNYISGSNVAGLVGFMKASRLNDSYSVSTINAIDDQTNASKIAGIVGVMQNNSFVTNAFYDGLATLTANTQAGGITLYTPHLVDPNGDPILIANFSLIKTSGFSLNKGISVGCFDDPSCQSAANVLAIDNQDGLYFKNSMNSPLSLFNQSHWVFSTNYPQLK